MLNAKCLDSDACLLERRGILRACGMVRLLAFADTDKERLAVIGAVELMALFNGFRGFRHLRLRQRCRVWASVMLVSSRMVSSRVLRGSSEEEEMARFCLYAMRFSADQ